MSDFDLTGNEQIGFLLNNVIDNAVSDSFVGSWDLYDVESASIYHPDTRVAGDLLESTATSVELFDPAVRGGFIMFAGVPEPATLAILALGIAGVGYARRKQDPSSARLFP